MADFEVQGAEQFLRLSRALKQAGRGDLRRELNTGIRKAARTIVPKTRAEARRRLPKRGGLAAQVAKEPQRAQVRTGQRTAGVRIVVANRAGGARGANRGRIRHPVFGNREVWVEQDVEPGWFDDPIKVHAPEIRDGIEQAMQAVVNKIIRDSGG